MRLCLRLAVTLLPLLSTYCCRRNQQIATHPLSLSPAPTPSLAAALIIKLQKWFGDVIFLCILTMWFMGYWEWDLVVLRVNNHHYKPITAAKTQIWRFSRENLFFQENVFFDRAASFLSSFFPSTSSSSSEEFQKHA